MDVPKFYSLSQFEFLPVPNTSENILGKGTFGCVKLARFKENKKLYALKIVNHN